MNANDSNQKTGGKKRTGITAAVTAGVIIVIIIAIATALVYREEPSAPVVQAPLERQADEVVDKTADDRPVLDYDRLDHDEDFAKEMQDRKDRYQLSDGIDMVVREDESLKIGDSTVSMEEIREKSELGKGRVVEKDLQKTTTLTKEEVKEYGVHVVRPGDNIWNIHFTLLRDYFQKRGITLSEAADEPHQDGTSSGVGKILKFSENMVTIYNVKKQRIELDLDVIHPLEKIVVYQMDEVFDLLSQIDYKKIDNLKFDGTTLWLPAEG